MIPFLTYPLALVALAALPALAAIYLLRNRARRKPVSSLLLWRFQVQPESGGAKIHRLRLPPLFFLELLALGLLVTAAAGPHWRSPQTTRPLIVILDDSFSMRAVRDGVSAQTRAENFLEKLLQRPPPSTRLILAGTEPRSLGPAARNWREVRGLLPQWQCWSPAAALDSAVTLAAELGRQQANILVLTDHPPADGKISDSHVNSRLEWRAFGSPLDNVAIVNASRTAFGDRDRCLLEIANFSGAARVSRLLVQTGTNAESSLLSLGAHASERLVFNISAAAPSLRAVLEPDALAEDNAAELLPPIRKKVRVQVALTNEDLAALAERTLAATGLRAALSANPEIVIREADSPAGSNAWNVAWSAAAATNAFTGPFIVDGSHPLAPGLTLAGVVWAAAMATNAPGEVPVILAGNVPLLSVRGDAPGSRRLRLNFNPGLSTLPSTPDFPVLFWNLLNWRAAETPGLKESNTRLGATVILKTAGQPVTIRSPAGVSQTFPLTGDEIALETPMPGIYSVTLGPATNSFSVNALAADESDLSGCASGQWGAWSEDPARRWAETSAVWICGLLALALLTAHLYLLAAVKGGR